MSQRRAYWGLWGGLFGLLAVSVAQAQPSSSQPTAPPFAVSTDDSQWTMPTKNFAATRYSELSEINADTVKNLQVAFTFSLGVNRGRNRRRSW